MNALAVNFSSVSFLTSYLRATKAVSTKAFGSQLFMRWPSIGIHLLFLTVIWRADLLRSRGRDCERPSGGKEADWHQLCRHPVLRWYVAVPLYLMQQHSSADEKLWRPHAGSLACRCLLAPCTFAKKHPCQMLLLESNWLFGSIGHPSRYAAIVAGFLKDLAASLTCCITVCAEKIAFTRAANNLGMTSHRLRGGLTLKHFEKG